MRSLPDQVANAARAFLKPRNGVVLSESVGVNAGEGGDVVEKRRRTADLVNKSRERVVESEKRRVARVGKICGCSSHLTRCIDVQLLCGVSKGCNRGLRSFHR